MERSVIVERVSALIADVLGLRPVEVQITSRLINDLGAESLDFLDIVFQLEDNFQIKITRGEIERTARGDLSEEEFAPGGVVSEAGLAQLHKLLPEASAHIKPGLHVAAILTLFTVETFVKIVEKQLVKTGG